MATYSRVTPVGARLIPAATVVKLISTETPRQGWRVVNTTAHTLMVMIVEGGAPAPTRTELLAQYDYKVPAGEPVADGASGGPDIYATWLEDAATGTLYPKEIG